MMDERRKINKQNSTTFSYMNTCNKDNKKKKTLSGKMIV